MILYDSNSLRFIWRLEGSIMPRACAFALPSVFLTVLLHYGLHNDPFRLHFVFLEEVNESALWSAFVIVLGLLLGVRTNMAYARFWEGITLVQQMRAEWFEAASNLMAFSMVACKKDDRMTDKVFEFQYILVRLMSLMHGAALRQIGGNIEEFDVLDIQSIDDESLDYLAACDGWDVNRVEVLLHWIQVLVTDSASAGIIGVSPPILTRAYQTLSRGMVNLHNARKLADIPFPFPLSQMTVTLLIVHSFITPFVVAAMAKNLFICVCVSFVPVFGMWGMTFVAGELEQPFGNDPNDLPLSVLQYEFNTTLLMLLDKEVSCAPHLVTHKAQSLDDLKHGLGSENPLSKTNSFCFTGTNSSRDRTNEAKENRNSEHSSWTQSWTQSWTLAGSRKHQLEGSHKHQLERRKSKAKTLRLTIREKEQMNHLSPISSPAKSPRESEYTDECSEDIRPRKSFTFSEQSPETGAFHSPTPASLRKNSTISQQFFETCFHNPTSASLQNPMSVFLDLPPIPTTNYPSPCRERSMSFGSKDVGWIPPEDRFKLLLDASIEASRFFATLLQELSVNVGAHRHHRQPPNPARTTRLDGPGVQKKRAFGTHPRVPQVSSFMPTPREHEDSDPRDLT